MAQKRKKNRLPLILGIIAILAFAGMALAKQQGWVGQKILTKIATEKIERRQIIETVSANGKIYHNRKIIFHIHFNRITKISALDKVAKILK